MERSPFLAQQVAEQQRAAAFYWDEADKIGVVAWDEGAANLIINEGLYFPFFLATD